MTPPPRNLPTPHPTQSAFSLLEVILALTIFALISGTIFSLVTGSIRATSDVTQITRENDQVHAFVDICRRTFSALPPDASLTLTIEGAGAPLPLQELVISGVPDAFGFGPNPISYEDTTIAPRPAIGPDRRTGKEPEQLTYTACISRDDLDPAREDTGTAVVTGTWAIDLAPDENGRYWLPLITDLAAFSWRFYHKDNDEWMEEWSDSEKPDLIELMLLPQGRDIPFRTVFRTPTSPTE